MKKLFIIVAALMLAVTLSACGKKEGKFDVENGTYFAVADEFSNGYKYWVVVTVKDKTIKTVEWNGYHIDGGAGKCKGDDKFTCSELGVYAMGGDKGEWHEQVELATKWIVKNQKLDVDFDDEGNTDAISSVSIHTIELFELVEEALDSNPVEKGDYEDGYYYYETEKTDKTVRYAKKVEGSDVAFDQVNETFKTYAMGTFLVVNGTIVIADFNAAHDAYEYIKADTGKFLQVTSTADAAKKVNQIVMVPKKDSSGNVIANEYVAKKKYVSKDSAGEWYGMKNANKVEWNVQIAAVEAKLLADQTINVTVDAEHNGTVDGVSSMTMGHTGADLKTLFDAFLADAE